MLTALVLLCSIGTTDCGNIAEAPDQTELPFMCLKIRPRGSGQTSGAGRQVRQGAVRAQERAPDYRVVAAWSGFLAFIGAGAFALGMAIHNEATAKPPALHSAGPAHNLERIFYAILHLKTGCSDSCDHVCERRCSRIKQQKPKRRPSRSSPVRTFQRLGAKQPRRRRAARRFPFIRYLSIERSQDNPLCSERPRWPRPSESATMSSDCLGKEIKRRRPSRALTTRP
jgi:hypothetical protein